MSKKQPHRPSEILPHLLGCHKEFLVVYLRRESISEGIGGCFLPMLREKSILSGFLMQRLKRMDERWARENELWGTLDKFLDDFSSFKEVPLEAYKL